MLSLYESPNKDFLKEKIQTCPKTFQNIFKTFQILFKTVSRIFKTFHDVSHMSQEFLNYIKHFKFFNNFEIFKKSHAAMQTFCD